MSLREKLYEEMQARHEAETRQAKSDTRRDLIRTALACWGWAALGCLCVAWSFHTTNERPGWIAFYSGVIINIAGQVYTLAAAYRRGEKRGDW